MIRLIVSSKALARELKQIQSPDFVQMAEFRKRERDDGYLVLYTREKKVIELMVASNSESQIWQQEDRRWDWVCDAVTKLSEQPIVLEISKNRVNIILQY